MKISDLAKNLTPLVYNPGGMRIATLATLRDVINGDSVELVDPSNPFIFMMDNAVALTSASSEHNESLLRRRYPIMATSMDELYPHMSDRDHLDQFAQPSTATWTLVLGRDELRQYAVPRDGKDVRKLVIPRDTSFSINGYTFTLQYAVEIRQMPHGGIQVVYDTTTESPIKTLSSNSLAWTLRDVPFGGLATTMIVIDIPVLQYKIETFDDTIVAGTTYERTFKFDDQFYTARVWLRDSKNKWVEIQTTHAQRVINPDVPTAQLHVKNGVLGLTMPDIYIRNRKAKGDVRIDIYTTKGKLDLDLRQFTADNFTFKLNDIGNEVNAGFYTPLHTFSNLFGTSSSIISGGRNALTFQEMKDRVVDNSLNGRQIPISDKQLESSLNDRGFKLTKSVDYVTERIYMASTEMPPSTIPSASTPVGNINGILETNLANLVKLDTVRDNGARLTITPDTLYREEYGMIVIDDVSITERKKLPGNKLVGLINANNYLYSPFHYVIDNQSNQISIRAYYLDNAKITSKRFVGTNTTLGLDVTTGRYEIEPVADGYHLRVLTQSGDSYKMLMDEQVGLQLSFVPRGYSDSRAIMNGEFLGKNADGERVFQFHITTNLDIDKNDDLIVSSFSFATANPTPTAMMLMSDMNVIHTVSNYTTPDYKPSDIDDVLVTDGSGIKGITHEVLNLELGTPLTRLWKNIRPINESIDYKRYAEDVYKVHPADVIKEIEGKPQYTVGGTPEAPTVNFVYLHRKNDPVLDANGDKIKLHSTGDIVKVDGKPVILNPRTVGWRMELFLFDARYTFSNTKTTETYMNMVTNKVIQYITQDLTEVDDMLLEKSDLYLFPRSTIGLVNVLKADGTATRVDAACRFELGYYLTSAGRQNSDLINTLARVSRQIILNNLEQRTVSVSAIMKDIRDTIGSEIVDVEMNAIGTNGDKLYTVMDNSSKLTLGKKCALNPDGTIDIRDDIAISYYRHDA